MLLNTSEHPDVEIDLHLSGLLWHVGHVALKSLGAGASTYALQVAGRRGGGKCGTSETRWGNLCVLKALKSLRNG